MSDALTAALTLLLATNRPAAASNLVAEATGLQIPAAITAPPVAATNDPVELELKSIMAEDDAAQQDIERLVTQAENPKDPLLAPQPLTLGARIRERAAPVRRRYERFIAEHPRHAKARMAFGSFLNDIGEEEDAIEQWEKARTLDPTDPAAWNNLANVYAHIGPVTKSFPYYEEALRLNPDEPVYLHNFGTLVFMFRRDATNYFKCDEQAVFTRAFELYKRAIERDPHNFQLAADVAQTYYGWRLPEEGPAEERRKAELNLQNTALQAWTNALAIAATDEEREGVQLHFARWNIRGGRYDEARTNLSLVTNEVHAVIRNRLMKSVTEHESGTRKSP
ncbi:MAG: tetratricopeptide repeat protein [Verrucomicrobiales bacterium]|nr:tetratricopeptide repeat protein [Verrucomicrobiales bacterium]